MTAEEEGLRDFLAEVMEVCEKHGFGIYGGHGGELLIAAYPRIYKGQPMLDEVWEIPPREDEPIRFIKDGRL